MKHSLIDCVFTFYLNEYCTASFHKYKNCFRKSELRKLNYKVLVIDKVSMKDKFYMSRVFIAKAT